MSHLHYNNFNWSPNTFVCWRHRCLLDTLRAHRNKEPPLENLHVGQNRTCENKPKLKSMWLLNWFWVPLEDRWGFWWGTHVSAVGFVRHCFIGWQRAPPNGRQPSNKHAHCCLLFVFCKCKNDAAREFCTSLRLILSNLMYTLSPHRSRRFATHSNPIKNHWIVLICSCFFLFCFVCVFRWFFVSLALTLSHS